MEVVLQQINKIQGVVGSFVCDEDGKMLGQALPPMYDSDLLQEAAGIIADSVLGVNNATGGVGSLDLRFSEGRIIVRPVQNCFLLLLCEQKINVQLLNMSLSVAQKKLEKTIQTYKEQPTAPQVSTAVLSSPAVVREPRKDGTGVVLIVDSMTASSKLKWDQMKEEAALSKLQAQYLYKIFKVPTIKKLRLTNKSTNKTKIFSIMIFDPEAGQVLGDKISLTLAASEALAAKPGDEITAEPITSSVFEKDLVFAGL